MWRVTSTEFDGTQHTITTESEFYARERYIDYEIAKKCGYIKNVTIERVD